MKGIELPINVLVIIATAVIVLLGIVVLYMSGAGGGMFQMSATAAENNACAELQRFGCGTTSLDQVMIDYDTNRDGSVDTDDNLESYCNNIRGGLVKYPIVEEDGEDVNEGNRILYCKVTICGCTGLPQPGEAVTE